MKQQLFFDDYFEKQFEHRDYIPTSAGMIETVDITPIRQKLLPVLFAPGWRETPELMKEALWYVYKSGRRVITVLHAIHNPKNSNGDFHPIEMQKAETLLEILSSKNIKQADSITHSEGAINVTIAAKMNLKLFRNVILVCPAGLIGTDNRRRLAYGFTQHLIETSRITPKILAGLQKKRKYHKPFFHPQSILFAFQEGKAITSIDIHPLLLQLRKKGLHIAVLAGEKDTAFPLERMKNHLLQCVGKTKTLTQKEKDNFGFDIFAIKSGGHEFYVNVEPAMRKVLNLLDELEIMY